MMHVRINLTLVLHELILGIANPNVKTIAIKAISEESRTQATRMPSAWVKSSISPQICEVSFHQKAGYHKTHFLPGISIRWVSSYHCVKMYVRSTIVAMAI